MFMFRCVSVIVSMFVCACKCVCVSECMFLWCCVFLYVSICIKMYVKVCLFAAYLAVWLWICQCVGMF